MLFSRRLPTPTVEQALAWLAAVRPTAVRADPEHVLDSATAALRLGPDKLGRAAAGRLHALRSSALLELKRVTEAAQEALQAEELAPLEPDVHWARAVSLFRTAQFAPAAASAQSLTAAAPGDARAWHLLGRIRLWLDPPSAADAAFLRAAQLAPRFFVVPYRVSSEEFDARAADAVTAVPPPIAAMLDNVMIRAFPLPPPDDVRGGLPPDLLGLYTGATVTAPGALYPARVALYQRNIETWCGDAASLAERLRRVVMHEVGHHLRMGHDELSAAGL